MCFKARFPNVPNGRSKYQPRNIKQLAGSLWEVGAKSVWDCTGEDNSCLEECPLRWIGQMEAEGVRLVAANSQPTAEVQVARTISLAYTWTRCFSVTILVSTGAPMSCPEVLCPEGCLGQRTTGTEQGTEKERTWVGVGQSQTSFLVGFHFLVRTKS